MSSGLTVLIHKKKRLGYINFSWKTFTTLTCLALCFLGVCSLAFVLVFKTQSEINILRYAEFENRQLKAEANHLVEKLSAVITSLDELDDLNEKIKLKTKEKIYQLTSYNQSLAKKALDTCEGKSACGEDSISEAMTYEDYFFSPALNKINDLQKQLKQQSEKSKTLSQMIHQQELLHDATPLHLPTKGWISSPYGFRPSPFDGKKKFHHGIDIATTKGTPIYAPGAGRVSFVGKKSRYGNVIILYHEALGIETYYAHNHKNLVKLGQKVQRGEKIATVGSSGRSTGPHLHFEIRVKGKTVNPLKFQKKIRDFGFSS